VKIVIFYIPCRDDNAASSLCQSAIKSQLAACGNIFPIKSFYPWNGDLQQDDESVLLLKTISILREKLSDFIAANHPYEVPCIMHWEVEVNEAYGKWIEDCVKNESS
jgi:periplasmic divalent cation tolerance protein